MRPHGYCAALLAAAMTAALAGEGRADKPGCEYKDIDVARYGRKPFQNPPEVVSRNGALTTPLATQYTDPTSVSIGGCGVRLRTYNGALVGPTLRAKPGDVLSIALNNRLPVESPAQV